jgi:ABC-type lipoprotein release transport system permease subunit
MGWRNVWRQRRSSLLTVIAMAVALAFCTSMLTLVNGVSSQIFSLMVEQQLGHIQLYHKDYPGKQVLFDTVPNGSEVLELVQSMEETAVASGRLRGFGLVGGEVKSSGAQLIGVYPEHETLLTPILRQVVAGEYLEAGAKREVVLGVDLAKKLELEVGGELIVIGQGADGSVANDLYTVRGFVKTGRLGVDRAGVFLHASDLQELLVMEGKLHEIIALTHDKDQIASYADATRSALQGAQLLSADEDEMLGVYTWWESNSQVAEMLKMQDKAVDIMIYLILLVAGFGILNTMLMSVFERTRELGMLRALGISRRRMVMLVVWESAVLACIACVAGVVLGASLSGYLVAYGLDFSTGEGEGFSFSGVMFDPIFYGIMELNDFIRPVIAVFVVAAFASLWPALRAAYLRPVEALRQE